MIVQALLKTCIHKHQKNIHPHNNQVLDTTPVGIPVVYRSRRVNPCGSTTILLGPDRCDGINVSPKMVLEQSFIAPEACMTSAAIHFVLDVGYKTRDS